VHFSVPVEHLVLIDSNAPSIGAKDGADKKLSGYGLQPVVFDGLKELQADPSGIGDIPKRDSSELSLSLEFLTEGCHFSKILGESPRPVNNASRHRLSGLPHGNGLLCCANRGIGLLALAE